MRTAVVTGSTGAIGVALIQKLVAKGVRVYAVARQDSSRIGRIPKGPLVEQVFLDLSKLLELKKWISEPCDVFYHLGWAGTIGAGRDDVYLQNQNVRYTLDAVQVAKELGCKRFVGAGSQAEYGRTEGDLRPDTPVAPETGYGMAKLCAGQMSSLLCKQLKMEHIWVRILSVYGPCDGEKTMVMSAIRGFLEKKIPEFTAGEQLWDYIYAKDAATAFYLLGEKGRSGRTYCLGSGQARRLAEYITVLRDSIDPLLPMKLGAVPYGDRQVMYLCADITALQQDTGFEPAYTFEEGIRETIDWYRKEIRA